jgi:hypothetical protein
MKVLSRALTAALFVGAALAPNVAGAVEPGFLSCAIVERGPDMVVIEAVVDPTLDAQLATIDFVSGPCMDLPMGATVLHAGTNLIAVPSSPMPGSYVLNAAGRVKTAEDETAGAQ